MSELIVTVLLKLEAVGSLSVLIQHTAQIELYLQDCSLRDLN